MQDGFFDMWTPGDLLQKLIHDFDRLKADPLSTYAAFDFFVTADHMLDWELPESVPGAKEEKSTLRKTNRLLAVCSHLGNGAKHFELSNPSHKSVRASELHEGAFQASAFANAFNVSRFVPVFNQRLNFVIGFIDVAVAPNRIVTSFGFAEVLSLGRSKLGL